MNSFHKYFLSYFFIILSSTSLLWPMHDGNLGKRGNVPQEAAPRPKVAATAIAQCENRFNSEKITLPLNIIVQAHLASETREQFASQLLDYLNAPSIYSTKNQTRNALAHKWIKNATSRIFSDENQFITELVTNACDASVDQINATGKNGIGFFSLFKLLELPAALIPKITLETTYRTTHDEFISYSIVFHTLFNPSTNTQEIVATFECKPHSTNSQTGTTIRITAQNEKFSDKMCATIEKKLKNSFRFYYHVPVILKTMKQFQAINFTNDHINPMQHVVTTITPENITIQDQGKGINLWEALQYLLVPSCTTNNQNTSQVSNTVKIPELAEPFDTTRRVSHFFMTLNGITLLQKKLATPILDSKHQSLDLHIEVPAQARTTLAHNELVITPDGASREELYLKNMISLTIDQAIDGSLGDQQIIHGLYQALEQWEQQSAQLHIQGLFSTFLQDELNKKLQKNKAFACPLEFFNLYNRHFNTNTAPVIPVHPALVFNNYEPLEQHLKKIGHSRLATPTKNQKKTLQNKAAGGGLIFGINVFFLPNIPEISHYGLRSCIFAPEESFFKNNKIPQEQELINQLILALPEKQHRQTDLEQARSTIHRTPEQQHLYNCFALQHEPLFKRFNINPQELINPVNFSYSWIENFTRPLDPLIPNRQHLTTEILQDTFNSNMLTLIAHHFEALPYLKEAFKTLQGSSNGGYQALFSFSSRNLPFCYGNINTYVEPSINNKDPISTSGTIASLIHALTQNWNQDNKQYLEKIMCLQMQDFAQKTAHAYRDKSLSQLQLYVPSGIHGTPLHLLGILANKQEYSTEGIKLIKTILDHTQTPEQLALIVVTLVFLDRSLLDYASSPNGLKSLTSIIQHYIQKKIDIFAMKKIYCSLHLINCNDQSALQKLHDNELLCTSIKTMLQKSAQGNDYTAATYSTLPKELSHVENLSHEKPFFLSQLFKTHCQKEDFATILEQENLDEIIKLVEGFNTEKLNKIEQCITGSEKHPIQESILECLQNSTDAAREFYQDSPNLLGNDAARILATIDMEINRLQKTNTHESLQVTIHDQAGFPSLKTLLTHFVLPDLSNKSSSNGSVGEMGNGSFKMYQKAEIVQILTRTTSNQNICYLLTIEPQRSLQSGLVEDLRLTCRNVSSITPETFRGTSITITFQEELPQATQITAGQITDFLHNCIGSTTAHLNGQIPFNITLHANNKPLQLNEDLSKNLIHQCVNDKNEATIKIFKRSNQNLQSFISTAGIPFCPFDIFSREHNLLPENFIRQLEKGYIVDFQLGTYKPVQSRSKIQLAMNIKELRTIFLDLFYIHGLNQAIEEQKLLQEQKISPQQSCLQSRFTHFLSKCNIFQLIPSQLDERQFNQDIQNYLESGIWQANLLEEKFFDFYYFQAGTNNSFNGYLREIKKVIDEKIGSFHDKMITLFKQSNQNLFDSITSTQDTSTIKDRLKDGIKQYLDAKSSQLDNEWFALHEVPIAFWRIGTINKLGDKRHDNAQKGLFIDIITPWLTNKTSPRMYRFNTEFYANYYAETIISLTGSANQAIATTQNASTQTTEAALLNTFFEQIHTKFCQDFLDSINAVSKINPISCHILKSLNHNVAGNYSVKNNTLNLNAHHINFLGLIQFIQLISEFDIQTKPIQQIHRNQFFNNFYWPCVGNIPTLIHELEHARRACYLAQYPGSSGCESHNDGYDSKNNFVNFEACAHSWAEAAFKNGLLLKLIANIQESMKNNPAIANKINHIASNPDSRKNRQILYDLEGSLHYVQSSKITPRVTSHTNFNQAQQPEQEDIFNIFRLHNVTQDFDLKAFLTVHEINEQDEDGCTILHYAVDNNYYQLTCDIIKLEANTNVQNKDGDTPLHLAYKNQKYNTPHHIIKLLLRSGGLLNIHNNEGETPLHYGVRHFAEMPQEILNALVSQNALNVINSKTGKTLLNEVISYSFGNDNDYKLIENLISLGADVGLADFEGNLPIHYAAKNKPIIILNKLLNKKPETIHVRNNKGQTPLFFALESQLTTICNYLFSKEANTDSQDHDGNNLMHQLLSLKRFPTETFIINIINKIGTKKAKELLNRPNIHGELPIHMIPANIPNTTLQFLIQKIDTLTLQDKEGNTLLHKLLSDVKIASSDTTKSTILENIEYLLTLMPRTILNLRNGYGLTPYQCTQNQELKNLLQAKQPTTIHLAGDMTNTPLHWAAQNGFTQHVRTYLQNGNYSVDSTHNGMTALHVACYHGHLETVKVLIELGSKLDNRDPWGHTSLHWATIGGHAHVIEYLASHNPEVCYAHDNFGKTAQDLAQNQELIALLEKHKPTTNSYDV